MAEATDAPRATKKKAGRRSAESEAALMALAENRLAIEGVTPEIDGGRFAVKRVEGEDLTISVDVFSDGHDKIARAVDSLNANVNTIQQHLTTLQKDVNDRKKAEAAGGGGGGGGGASLGYYGLLLAAQCLCIAALLFFKSRGAKREHLL